MNDDGERLAEAAAEGCHELNLAAISSAFALVACADDELSDREIERFRGIMREADACQGLDLDRLEQEFLTLTRAMLEDYAEGKLRAYATIREVRDEPLSRDRVLAAAQVAVVADGEIREVEEQVLREICELLGVDPEAY